MKHYWRFRLTVVAALALCAGLLVALEKDVANSQTSCVPASQLTCGAERGDRAEGWLAQSRSPVIARYGMVTTSQPLAAQAGLQIMMRGGNAIDAAVTAAAVLNVTEPQNVGIGGDLFAIVYTARDRRTHVLNASGVAPSGATLAHFNELGYAEDKNNWGPGSGMPPGGILDVTVPGTIWGFDSLLRRYGTMQFKQVLQPAIDYAEKGFPVSERIADDWNLPNALPLRNCCSKLDPDTVKAWSIDGKPPTEGQIFRNPDLARAFQEVQRYGSAAFYNGAIARAIVSKSQALGGTMTLADLASYRGEWVEPVVSTYHGYEISELPPPSQGFAANEALNILEVCVPKLLPNQTLAKLGPASPIYWHLLIEAKKIAYADLYAYNADPNFEQIPLARLLSKSYASSRCDKIDVAHASSTGPAADVGDNGDTIVLSTADRFGNMVSLVNSNYDGFGSGITVPGYGFILHDRGGLFSLNPKSPNAIAPHKRPFTTLAAAFVRHDGLPFMTLGLMGGLMQSQGHEQVLVDLIDLGANVQQAGDMARFRHNQIRNTVELESTLATEVGSALRALGHKVESTNRRPMGGYQAIMVSTDVRGARAPVTVYLGGSDFGKDGEAVGW